jgi:integrase
MAGSVRHLLSRNGRFYARVAVPQALRSTVGKRELLEPIGADRTQALRALPAAVARMQATIGRAREDGKVGKPLSPPRIKGRALSPRQMALVHYSDQMSFDEELRNTDHRYASGFIDDEYVALLKRCSSGASSNDEMQRTVGWIVHKFKANGNLEAETGTPEWREAARALALAELESLRRTAERDDGDFTGKPDHPLLTEQPKSVDPKGALSVRILGHDSTKTLAELLPLFLKERGATGRSDYDSEVTVRMLDEILEEARPVYRITRADITAYKRALSETPSNYTKRFSGAKLPDAIKANKAHAVPFPLLHAKTINGKYLSKLHSLLNWCVRNDIIPDNPAAAIKVDSVKDKSKTPRLHFSPSDLGTVFGAKRFDKSKGLNESQWAELVALFSGTRASELAQIKLDSVRTERGVLVMAVEEETKNKGSQRIVPVHSSLIALGFADRVKSLCEQRHTHLFPDWHKNGMKAKARAESHDGKATLNHYSPRFIPKRFIAAIRALGIHNPQKTWHSFRHTFRTGLARAGVPRSMQDDLCRHADNSAGAGYVHGTSVEAMKEAIEKLTLDGFELAKS